MDSEKKLYKALMKRGYKGHFKIVGSFDVCDIVAAVKLDDYKGTKFTLKENCKEERLEEVPEGYKIHFLKFLNPRDTRKIAQSITFRNKK